MSEGIESAAATTAWKKIFELDEWKRYAADPSSITLSALSKAAANDPLAVFRPMAEEYARTSNWKIAQHIAIKCNQWERLTLAFYYAHQAMGASGDNTLARLTYAEVLWKKRLPSAVLYHTPILWDQAGKLTDMAQQAGIRSSAANLEVCCWAYLGDLTPVRDRLAYCYEHTSFRMDTVAQLLLSTAIKAETDLHSYVAMLAAPHADSLGPRVRSRIESGLRKSLVRALRLKYGV